MVPRHPARARLRPHLRARSVADRTRPEPNDPNDGGDVPWQRPPVLDVGHNDYYKANIPSCPELSRSAYLKPTPARGNHPRVDDPLPDAADAQSRYRGPTQAEERIRFDLRVDATDAEAPRLECLSHASATFRADLGRGTLDSSQSFPNPPAWVRRACLGRPKGDPSADQCAPVSQSAV